ncbi:prolyl 4-hydroxylase subunit alpha-2-like protein [Corchorus olitorius]|uniref:Prolyl 4-hydroxylase subunit alpha-2-like protein n=1 Tax=Corchorus olitorius TaxID=93759 RepID=A0A1R3JQ58_9ROSI|nr:prolyl 4-hydroxylase subunit alpha-2-like protein [Corchorus olitorius]
MSSLALPTGASDEEADLLQSSTKRIKGTNDTMGFENETAQNIEELTNPTRITNQATNPQTISCYLTRTCLRLTKKKKYN